MMDLDLPCGSGFFEGPLDLHPFGDAADVRKLDPLFSGLRPLNRAPPEGKSYVAGRHFRFHFAVAALEDFHPAVMRKDLRPAGDIRCQGKYFFKRSSDLHTVGSVYAAAR